MKFEKTLINSNNSIQTIKIKIKRLNWHKWQICTQLCTSHIIFSKKFEIWIAKNFVFVLSRWSWFHCRDMCDIRFFLLQTSANKCVNWSVISSSWEKIEQEEAVVPIQRNDSGLNIRAIWEMTRLITKWRNQAILVIKMWIEFQILPSKGTVAIRLTIVEMYQKLLLNQFLASKCLRNREILIPINTSIST